MAWKDPVSDDFGEAANWDPATVPNGPQFDALFNVGGAFDVIFNDENGLPMSATSNSALVSGSADVVFRLQGQTYSVESAIVDGAAAELELLDGDFEAGGPVSVGVFDAGAITVTGPETFFSAADLLIGENANSAGNVLLRDAAIANVGSIVLAFATGSTGTLNMDDSYLGGNPDLSITVGREGDARMTLDVGSEVAAENVLIAEVAGFSILTVTNESLMTVTGDLRTSGAGSGALNVLVDAFVNHTGPRTIVAGEGLWISEAAMQSQAADVITPAGAGVEELGTWTVVNDLNVGDESDGHVYITTGSLIDVGTTLYIRNIALDQTHSVSVNVDGERVHSGAVPQPGHAGAHGHRSRRGRYVRL